MNIKNRPVVQMGQKDQIINNLKRELELCRMENKWLKQQLNQATGGEFEIDSSIYDRGLNNNNMNMNIENINDMRMTPISLNRNQLNNSINNSGNNSLNISRLNSINHPNTPQNPQMLSNLGNNNFDDKMLKEFNFELKRLRGENNQLRTKNVYLNKNLMELIEENTKLVNRIESLEHVFVKKEEQEILESINFNDIYNRNGYNDKNINNKENIIDNNSKIISENNILRTRINKLEKELI